MLFERFATLSTHAWPNLVDFPAQQRVLWLLFSLQIAAHFAAHFAFKMSEFEVWLGDQLRQINTDESVFGSYIIGILEGDEETQEEKVEALEGILSDTGVS